MSAWPRCDECGFYRVNAGPGGVETRTGTCRRYPPTTQVRHDDWCGEYRKNEFGNRRPAPSEGTESEVSDVG